MKFDKLRQRAKRTDNCVAEVALKEIITGVNEASQKVIVGSIAKLDI